jgi:hypothetical protein
MKVNAFSAGLWVVALGIALSALSCSPSGKFGAPISASKETAINEVLDDPEDFVGKTVILKGQIQTVDDDGKGFTLDNGLGSVIYVKVAGDFTIAKAAKYRLTTAEGKVELDKETKKPRLLAAGVTVK